MRIFVAIDIDPDVRKGLGELQDKLAGSVDIKKGDVKWVKADGIHLTLKFLGEVDDAGVARVCDIVAQQARRHRPFELVASGVGYFGRGSARVLWVGIEQSDALNRLQKDIEQALADAGWPEESRPFSAHLTLCRVRNTAAGKKLAAATEQFAEVSCGRWKIKSVCVYQSQLTRAGANYTVLSETVLAGESGGKNAAQ